MGSTLAQKLHGEADARLAPRLRLRSPVDDRGILPSRLSDGKRQRLMQEPLDLRGRKRVFGIEPRGNASGTRFLGTTTMHPFSTVASLSGIQIDKRSRPSRPSMCGAQPLSPAST